MLHHLVVLPLLVAVKAVCEAHRDAVCFQLLCEGLDVLLNSTKRERLLCNIKWQLRQQHELEVGAGGHSQQPRAWHYTKDFQLRMWKRSLYDTPPSEQG